MYRFKTFRSEDWFWITNEKEIRSLCADVDKAINIVVDPWRRLFPFSVWPIVVSGGCHERDTGYEAFSGGEYPWRDGWVEKLVEDFNKEKNELDGSWFNKLNFSDIIVIIFGRFGPIVLEFEDGEMAVTVCYDDKEEERNLLDRFAEAFERTE